MSEKLRKVYFSNFSITRATHRATTPLSGIFVSLQRIVLWNVVQTNPFSILTVFLLSLLVFAVQIIERKYCAPRLTSYEATLWCNSELFAYFVCVCVFGVVVVRPHSSCCVCVCCVFVLLSSNGILTMTATNTASSLKASPCSITQPYTVGHLDTYYSFSQT